MLRARFYRPGDALPRACARGAGLALPFRTSPALGHFDWRRRPGFDACVTGMGGLQRWGRKSRCQATILALSEVLRLVLWRFAFLFFLAEFFPGTKPRVSPLQPSFASLPMADVSPCAPQLALLIGSHLFLRDTARWFL